MLCESTVDIYIDSSKTAADVMHASGILSTVPTTVLNSATFRTLSETKMSAAVAAAMDYVTKRGCKTIRIACPL